MIFFGITPSTEMRADAFFSAEKKKDRTNYTGFTFKPCTRTPSEVWERKKKGNELNLQVLLSFLYHPLE